ncbi:hypothetical protein [Methylobacterium oxalidis]|uniref:hypothetical protein n=1 Tax=Methylobacterium oxalidis TaxID=944322 RepID=UPI0033157F22
MAQQTITALFDSYDDASAAVTKLEAVGIPHSDISIVASNEGDRRSYLTGSTGGDHDEAKEGAETGAGTGATLGTLAGGAVGLLTGLGLMAIPGVGPVVAAGWLVTTLTGAGVGAAAGGLTGGLVGAGVSETDAHTYAEGVRRGGTLVTVRADEAHAASAMDILEQHGSVDVDERARNWKSEGWAAPTVSETAPVGGPAGEVPPGSVEGRRGVRSYLPMP